MQHILNLISDDRHAQREAYRFLLQKWPQLNDRTRISYTDNPVVYIAEVQPINLFDDMVRVVAMTPTLTRLDDPQERIRYSHRLWSAIFKSPTYVLWRIAGTLFKRSDWYMRGTELTMNPKASYPINRREVRIEQFGIRLTYERHIRPEPLDIRFWCGYDAPTDTLYVRQR